MAIFNKMTGEERLRICLEMMDEGREQLRAMLRRKNPHWSAAEVEAGAFRQLYRDDLSPSTLEEMAQGVLDYHQRNPPPPPIAPGT